MKDINDVLYLKWKNKKIYIDELTRNDHLLFLSLRSKWKLKEKNWIKLKFTYKQDLVYQAFVNDCEHYDKQQEIMLQLNPKKSIGTIKVLKNLVKRNTES